MSRKSDKQKLEEYMKRKREILAEKDRRRCSKDYQPINDGKI